MLEWLGQDGYEKQTIEWLVDQEIAQKVPVELDTISDPLEEATTMILDNLPGYKDILCSAEGEGVTLALSSYAHQILALAKGKGKNDQDIFEEGTLDENVVEAGAREKLLAGLRQYHLVQFQIMKDGREIEVEGEIMEVGGFLCGVEEGETGESMEEEGVMEE